MFFEQLNGKYVSVLYTISEFTPINLLCTKQIQNKKKKYSNGEGTRAITALLAVLLEEVWLYNAVKVKRGQMIYSLKGVEHAQTPVNNLQS